MTLKAEHLTAGYKGHTVLRDVSLAVSSGEVAALAGPNGAGKSTLLAIMAGVHRVSHPSLVVDGGGLLRGYAPRNDGGGAVIDDVPVQSMTPSRRAQLVSFMAQSERSAWDYSALEVVRMGRYARCMGHYTHSDTAAACEALDMVGAAELEGRGVLTLSGGQWQRVRLARAIVQGAPFMLLDEPSTGLDMGFREEFLSILRTLSRERGAGVLFSTHDVNLATRYCDTLALLDAAGRLATGSAEEMMRAELLSKSYGVNIAVAHHPELGAVAYVPDVD